ncbi:MAG: DUF4145 domain-containing protein [Actinomycetota bacterium]|nr:DUF4145 domain-containing protein [Actinomycetota bacterium]
MNPVEAANWGSLTTIEQKAYTCGHCGRDVGSSMGFSQGPSGPGRIYICGFCRRPTFISLIEDIQVPGPRFGRSIDHLPEALGVLYDEARSCMAVNAFTAAVLAARKILMHVSVDLGAKEGRTFLNYITFLVQNNHISARSKVWVDHIRAKGNEANHEIRLATRDEADLLLRFVEMLLRITYEFPESVPAVEAGVSVASESLERPANGSRE